MINQRLAISNAVLAGVSIYGIKKAVNGNLQLPLIAYGITAVSGILGVIKYETDDSGGDLNAIYDIVCALKMLFPFPCITGALWLRTHYPHEYAFMHPAASIIPFAMYLSDCYDKPLVDGLLALNVISCCYVSIIKENWFGALTALIFAATEGVITTNHGNVTRLDTHNYLWANCIIASFFALGAIKV